MRNVLRDDFSDGQNRFSYIIIIYKLRHPICARDLGIPIPIQ